MEWEPKRITVTLDPAMSELAGGVTVVTCRYLGPSQQAKIDIDIQLDLAENRKAAGEEWAHRMVKELLELNPKKFQQQEERIKKRKMDDPVEWALDRWPQGFVCRHAIKAFDAKPMGPSDVDAWLEEGPSPVVTRHIALAVLGPSDLIPETEKKRGEGSGASSAV